MSKRSLKIFLLVAAFSVLSVALVAAADDGFPLREKFPKVKPMTTEVLYRDYQKVIIVDVRSKIEFDVIHINKAVHLPVTTAMFVKDLAKVRDKNGSAAIAFYCNGHTCAKSYEAADQALAAGFNNVYAYDSGIYDWVKAHPDRGTLMGQTPAPVQKLISHEMRASKTIKYDEFKKKAQNPAAIVVDIREPFQRETIPPLPALRNIPSDRFAELLKTGEFKGKELMILDAVGKQVEWIQYYLEMYGYTNYFFLDKGVAGAR